MLRRFAREFAVVVENVCALKDLEVEGERVRGCFSGASFEFCEIFCVFEIRALEGTVWGCLSILVTTFRF